MVDEHKSTDGPKGTASAEELAEIFRKMKETRPAPESLFKEGTGTGICVTGELRAEPVSKE